MVRAIRIKIGCALIAMGQVMLPRDVSEMYGMIHDAGAERVADAMSLLAAQNYAADMAKEG